MRCSGTSFSDPRLDVALDPEASLPSSERAAVEHINPLEIDRLFTLFIVACI
jgi:hypothetical protein